MADVYYQGNHLTVFITADGVASITKLCRVHRAAVTAELARANKLTKMLADSGRLRSPDQFRSEGDGFFAIKAAHIRFYGWYEPNSCFVISHCIYKSQDKLASSDATRMHRNRDEYRQN